MAYIEGERDPGHRMLHGTAMRRDVGWEALSDEWPSPSGASVGDTAGEHMGDKENREVSTISSNPPWKTSAAEGMLVYGSFSTPSRPKLAGVSLSLVSAAESVQLGNPLERASSADSSLLIENQAPSCDPFAMNSISTAQSKSFSIENHTADLEATPKPSRATPARETFSFSVDPPAIQEPPVIAAAAENFVPLFGSEPYSELMADLEELDELDCSSFAHEHKRIRLDDDPDSPIPASAPVMGDNNLSTIIEDPKENLSPERSSSLKKAEYPEHIDFLDDISEGFELNESAALDLNYSHEMEENQGATNDLLNVNLSMGPSQSSSNSAGAKSQGPKKSKMVTIRNLNMSSALMNMLGDSHNMSFNHEQNRWEGGDDELDTSQIFGSQKRESFQAATANSLKKDISAAVDPCIQGLTEMEHELDNLAKIGISKTYISDFSKLELTTDKPPASVAPPHKTMDHARPAPLPKQSLPPAPQSSPQHLPIVQSAEESARISQFNSRILLV